jgi:Kef-type K+ transport system membrane component KefB/nucleotide-binding universal stress UspA family protein
VPHLELSPLILLLAQIAAIVLLSRLLGLVTRRLGQPLVVAEVLAGILLGPSLLGLVWPEAMHALFPDKSIDALKMLSQVGLVLFMFLVGLEFDSKLLRGRTHSSVVISHTSIIVPFALGAAAAWWLHDEYSTPETRFLPFMLFLGASMSVTAFPVLARILSERQLMTSRVGGIAIACAAVDDVTAWCILAFVVAVTRATGVSAACWTTGLALAFIVTMLVVIRPFLRQLVVRVGRSREGLTQGMVAAILFCLLIASGITEMIGIHALFGAFLFGTIIPKEGLLAETLADKLETVAVVLLLPLFFAYSGLRTDIGLISDPKDWAVAITLILLATVGKFGGSAIAAQLTGLRWRESCAIGILMNTRGLMELIVLNIGMDLGVITRTVFTMLVIMALVTTVATTPILRIVYPESELERDRRPEPPRPARGPAPYTVMMYVSDEASGPGLATVAAGLLGQRDQPSRLLALHLYPPTDRPSVERRRSGAGRREGPLLPLLQQARALMLEIQPLDFVSSDPAEDVCRTAEEQQASLVLLGAHKPLLLEGRLSGAVGDVIAGAKTPVGVLLDRGLKRIRRVLVAYSGGPEDLEALRLAQRLGRAPGVELTFLHVVPPGRGDQPGPGRAQLAAYLGEAALRGGGQAVADQGLAHPLRMQVVEHESPPVAVLEEARRGYDLIVLGMNARWGIEAGMISPKRRRVLIESPVSILAVHPPLAAAAEAVEEAGEEQPVSQLADSPG